MSGGVAADLDHRQEGRGQDHAGGGPRGRAGATQVPGDDHQTRHARGRSGPEGQGHLAALARREGRPGAPRGPRSAGAVGATRARGGPGLARPALPGRRGYRLGGGVLGPPASQDRGVPAGVRPRPDVRPARRRRRAVGRGGHRQRPVPRPDPRAPLQRYVLARLARQSRMGPRQDPSPLTMLTPAEAAQQILADIRPLEPERLPLREALDRVLAEDVVSPIDLPPWDNSAMDGYAVRAADVGPGRELQVIETVAAGQLPRRALGAGEATRFFTGAPLPSGADSVIRQEDTEPADGTRVRLTNPRDAGKNRS